MKKRNWARIGKKGRVQAMRPGKAIDKLISEALAIEAEEAKKAGAIGYMARALVQATMPHKAQTKNEFTRQNGSYTLSLMASSKVGLPYGNIPRLLIAWIGTEVVRTKDRELILGDSLSDFMRQLGLVPTGGRWGSITRLREQSQRLFSCFISCSYTDKEITVGKNIIIADAWRLWWQPKDLDQITLFPSSVTLSESFYEEIIQNPVPIDMRALNALKRSSLALDIYCWVTYRMSYLNRPTVIPWEALQLQFGADYQLSRQFKAAFLQQLKKVKVVYPNLKVEDHANGLLLKPSPTHIPPILR